MTCTNLGEYSRNPQEALAWYDKALAQVEQLLAKEPGLDSARVGQQKCFVGKARALGRLGQYADAEKLIRDVGQQKDLPDPVTFDAACVLALCSGGESLTPNTQKKLADQSICLLRRVYAAGYFADASNRDELRKETSLDPLRQREDFKKLLADVEPHRTPVAR